MTWTKSSLVAVKWVKPTGAVPKPFSEASFGIESYKPVTTYKEAVMRGLGFHKRPMDAGRPPKHWFSPAGLFGKNALQGYKRSAIKQASSQGLKFIGRLWVSKHDTNNEADDTSSSLRFYESEQEIYMNPYYSDPDLRKGFDEE